MITRSLRITFLFVLAQSFFGRAFADCVIKPTQLGLRVELKKFSASYPELITKLNKSLASSVYFKLSLANAGKPVELNFGCKLTYDLWKERYFGERQEQANKTTFDLSAQTLLADLPDDCQSYNLSTVVEGEFPKSIQLDVLLNPVDESQVQRTRSWLAEHGFAGQKADLASATVGAITRLQQHKTSQLECIVKS